jgi:hypothetical protein
MGPQQISPGLPLKMFAPRIVGLFALWLLAAPGLPADKTAPLRGEILDAASGKPLPARLYIEHADGRWFFARSAAKDGSAVEYRKQRSKTSVEMHTTLSAHPFVAELPPGEYTLTVERGKEYLPETRKLKITDKAATVTFRLARWIDMAARGWYSGDTHVHRTLEELPNVVMAEDLNVALPLTAWVTTSGTPPNRSDRTSPTAFEPKPIAVDATHVIYPVNTEYEIFSVGKRRHTLGAVFVLNHKRPLAIGVPPVRPVADQARREEALLDLDKHSWPWSLMLVPVMQVDLFELANNHVWRTEFAFRDWTRDTVPEHMGIETDKQGLTEWGWIDFGFKTYYALLDCGFRLRPTAGTASGVHPVPLGFGRVYVNLPGGFDYAAWMKGLDAGRSFVTTGPMLLAEFNGQPPGHVFRVAESERATCRIRGTVESAAALDRVEIVVNGEIRKTIRPANQRTPAGGRTSPIDESLEINESSWVVVRCFEKHAGGRLRFAHTAPVHFELAGRPLRPRKADVQYFIARMQQELKRNEGVLSKDALQEYRDALAAYRRIAEAVK